MDRFRMVGRVIGGRAFSNAADTPTAEHLRPGFGQAARFAAGGVPLFRSIWEVGRSTDPHSDGVSAHLQS